MDAITKTGLTLDEATERWKEARGPNKLTAANLLLTALEYWLYEMLSDKEFGRIVQFVAVDLKQSVEG